MRLDLPTGLEAFAREFSRYKTPEKRTQGFADTKELPRGDGDTCDTIGSLMLWRHLCEHDIPTTYLLTGRQGDEADVRVGAGTISLDINVKTSTFCWADDRPCERNHIAVKQEELAKALPDLYVQLFVHLKTTETHVHLCNWIATQSAEFRAAEVTNIPGTGGQKGLWIPVRDTRPASELVAYLNSQLRARGSSLS